MGKGGKARHNHLVLLCVMCAIFDLYTHTHTHTHIMVGVRAGSRAGDSDDDPDDGDSDHLQRQGLRENFNGNAGAMEDGLWVQVHRRHRGKGGFQRKNFNGTVPNAFSDQETRQRESYTKKSEGKSIYKPRTFAEGSGPSSTDAQQAGTRANFKPWGLSKERGSAESHPLKVQARLGTHTKLHFAPGSTPASWKDICLLGRKLDDISRLTFIQPSKLADGDFVAKN